MLHYYYCKIPLILESSVIIKYVIVKKVLALIFDKNVATMALEMLLATSYSL